MRHWEIPLYFFQGFFSTLIFHAIWPYKDLCFKHSEFWIIWLASFVAVKIFSNAYKEHNP